MIEVRGFGPQPVTLRRVSSNKEERQSEFGRINWQQASIISPSAAGASASTPRECSRRGGHANPQAALAAIIPVFDYCASGHVIPVMPLYLIGGGDKTRYTEKGGRSGSIPTPGSRR
jgi:hypothetical protein